MSFKKKLKRVFKKQTLYKIFIIVSSLALVSMSIVPYLVG